MQKRVDDIAGTQKLDNSMLHEMISKLAPKKEVFAGKRFFELLMKRHGAQAVLDFVTKATKALSENDGLDLAFDFNDDEKRAFNDARLNLVDRRHFLNTVGWGLPGMYFAGAAAADMAVGKPLHADSAAPASVRYLEAVKHYGGPPMELLIGAALVNEAHEKWLEYKLEQLADAVSLMAEKIKAQEPPSARMM